MRKSVLFTTVLVVMLLAIGNAQNLRLPRESQAAEVIQNIGVCKVSVSYARPAVKGRKIWGDLVPYGYDQNDAFADKKMPWRAGANENTTITFSHAAMVNGQPIAAGTYGFHILPAASGAWTLIFSKDIKAWGSYFYNEANDVLRVTAEPKESAHEEFLRYGFDEVKSNAALLYLAWEKLKIGFTVSFDMEKYVLQDINEQLTGALGFNWQGYNAAASWTLRFPAYLQKGEEWARISVSRNENSTNKNTLAYVLLNLNKKDEAMKLFKENTEKFPGDYNVFDSYAEALALAGNKEEAKKYYKIALEKAPASQKARIEKDLKALD